MKRGDIKPATAKLGTFGTALGELRNRLRGAAHAEIGTKSEGPILAATAAEGGTENVGARKQLQERSVSDAEKARLATNPALKPSWSIGPKVHAPNQIVTGRALRHSLLLKAKQARATALAAARGRLVNQQTTVEGEEPPQPPPPFDPMAQRKQTAVRLRHQLSIATPIVEARVSQVCEETMVAVAAAVERGARIFSINPEPNLDGYIVGLDLGTSSVKCAYRQPYRAGDPVRCLSVPMELRSLGHPCLWQTVLWFHPELQTFALTPSEGAVALDGFKSGLIHDQGKAPAREGIGVTKSEAMTAFIALNLAYAIGAYSLQRPLGPNAAEHFLSINIGIPVAAHDDTVTRGTFEKMVRAARELAPMATDLTLSDLRKAYASGHIQLPNAVHLIPELVAAMSAYAADPTAPDGAHFLVDVGASTLDMVAFNLLPQRRISVFTASVEMLGAAALKYARTIRISGTEFKAACDESFEQVYGGARRKAPSLFHPGYRKRFVQLIKTGGGCRTAVHDKFIAEMPKERVLGEFPVLEPQPPSEITQESCDKARLLLAYGLTRDVQELLALRLPSEIDDLPPPRSMMPEPIGPEQM